MTDQRKTKKPQTQAERNPRVPPGELKGSGSARPRVRKVRYSPVTDRKKVQAARASVQKLKAKQRSEGQAEAETEPGADNLDDLEVPLITPGL
jgi:hypothetical protein